MMNAVMQIARTKPGRWLIRLLFDKMTFAIPAQRLRETSSLMAFRHPQPAYPFHVILVPKKAVASLSEFDSSDTTFLSDLFQNVQSLVAEFQLSAYRLIVNGGGHQDFPQLHFHLISEDTREQSNVKS
jgi:histidine triad (HIT) family protein